MGPPLNPSEWPRIMGSNLTPGFLEAALAERYRLEALLRHYPEFCQLEAILRLLESYQQTVGFTDPGGSLAASAPPRKPSDIETASGTDRPPHPAASATRSSPSLPGSSDGPVMPRRGGWKKENSESSRIRNAAAEYLTQDSRRAGC